MAQNKTIKKIDEIRSSIGDLDLVPSGNLGINSPLIEDDQLLHITEIGGKRVLKNTGVPSSSVLKNNLSASTDPTSGDSGFDGYAEGSLWYNQTNNSFWVCEDASFTPPVFADFTGQVAGMTTDVTIQAQVAGTIGNSITLSFNGVDTIFEVIDAWNIANPANTAILTDGDGDQVPNNATSISLSGGLNVVESAVWQTVGGTEESLKVPIVWQALGDSSPVYEIIDGFEWYRFDESTTLELYAQCRIPYGFTSGTIIQVKGGLFAGDAASGNILIKYDTSFLGLGESYINSSWPTQTSLSSQVGISDANLIDPLNWEQLTDNSGDIQGVTPYTEGNLRIRLYRDIPNETGSAVGFVWIAKNGFFVDFSGA